MRWEHEPSTYGRPQETLNEQLRSCHIFVGLLWKRWGTPSGAYSSGFEEEFELALQLRDKNDLHDIALYFKSVDPDQERDAGPELMKVLGFRKRVQEMNTLLYRPFETGEQWRAELHKQLGIGAMDLWKRYRAASATNPAGPITPQDQRPTTSMDLEAQQDAGNASAEQQVRELFAQLAALSLTPDADESTANTPSDFELARLSVRTATWMRRHVTSFIGTQEANLAYRFRTSVKLDGYEKDFLFKAMLADESGYVPGWYWLNSAGSSDLRGYLLSVALFGESATLRRASINLLIVAGVAPSAFHDRQLEPRSILAALLDDTRSLVRERAIDYFGHFATGDDLDLLDAVEDSIPSSLRPNTAFARALAVSRDDPLRALSLLNDESLTIHQEARELAARCCVRLDTSSLASLVAKLPMFALTKIAIANELFARAEVTPELARNLLEDYDIELKRIGALTLLRATPTPEIGEIRAYFIPEPPISSTDLSHLFMRALRGEYGVSLSSPYVPARELTDEQHEVLLECMRRVPVDQLHQQLDFYSEDALLSYEALATFHGADEAGTIRGDLSDRFRRLREKSAIQLQERYGAEAAIRIAGDESFVGMRTNRFIRIGIAWMIRHGSVDDIPIARTLLREADPTLQGLAIRFLQLHGARDTALELLDFATRTASDELGRQALRAALSVPTASKNWTKQLLTDERARTRAVALEFVDRDLGQEGVVDVKPLLLDDDTEVRMEAAKYVARKSTSTALEAILNEYVERETYYFDVVALFDGALYAPTPFKDTLFPAHKPES